MTSPATPTSAHRSPVSRFFRNPDTGEVVVAQWPNLPLWSFLVASAVRMVLHPDGTAGTALSIVSGVAIIVWSVLEIAQGASPFRRVLGGVVLLTVVSGLLLR